MRSSIRVYDVLWPIDLCPESFQLTRTVLLKDRMPMNWLIHFNCTVLFYVRAHVVCTSVADKTEDKRADTQTNGNPFDFQSRHECVGVCWSDHSCHSVCVVLMCTKMRTPYRHDADTNNHVEMGNKWKNANGVPFARAYVSSVVLRCCVRRTRLKYMWPTQKTRNDPWSSKIRVHNFSFRQTNYVGITLSLLWHNCYFGCRWAQMKWEGKWKA